MFDFSASQSACSKQHKIRLITKIIISLIFALVIFSCSGYQYDGDILSALQEDTNSTISFKKDRNSEVVFTLTYKIGLDYSSSDLPGNDNEDVDKMNPGFELGGWLPDSSDTDFMSAVVYDEKGFIKSFHMTPSNVIFYGAGYTASTDTPYKVVHKIQNDERTGYEVYSEVTLTGTTSTPEAPSYTAAADNLLELDGYRVRLDLLEEKEILGDGSTVVEVFYDRLPEINIVISIPQTNEVEIQKTVTNNTITLTALPPAGSTESDYTWCWFYTEQGMTSSISTTASCTIDKTTLVNGLYQISLIAVRISDSVPFGGTVQIQAGGTE